MLFTQFMETLSIEHRKNYVLAIGLESLIGKDLEALPQDVKDTISSITQQNLPSINPSGWCDDDMSSWEVFAEKVVRPVCQAIVTTYRDPYIIEHFAPIYNKYGIDYSMLQDISQSFLDYMLEQDMDTLFKLKTPPVVH